MGVSHGLEMRCNNCIRWKLSHFGVILTDLLFLTLAAFEHLLCARHCPVLLLSFSLSHIPVAQASALPPLPRLERRGLKTLMKSLETVSVLN